MKIERKKVLAQQKLSPTMIMALPAITQLPVFFISSLVFARIVQFPSVLDSESVWTLTSLVSPDPTGTIPIAIGLITLANVESSQWFITDAQKARQEKVEQWNAEKRAQGHLVLEPKKIVQNALRGLSVVRILISAVVPGVSDFGFVNLGHLLTL
jgi:mitochondrial inner membrane protein COX18